MAFHWKDNWFFERFEDGSVHIHHHKAPGEEYIDVCIDADSWASILASVCAKGETAESWKMAQALHAGKWSVSFIEGIERICTCGMCPTMPEGQFLSGAFHEANPNDLIPARELCQWHKEHGNEGLHYVVGRTQ